ncbi:MAG: hypothetical protein MHMPM18_004667 [Marteilia pararefringens]
MDDIDQIDQEYIRSQLQCDDLKISKTSRQTALLHFPSPESGNSILRHFWRDFDSPRSRISELRNKILGLKVIYWMEDIVGISICNLWFILILKLSYV